MTNLRSLLRIGLVSGRAIWQTGLGAIAFYTCIPVPQQWPLNFSGIARWAPVIGLMLGSLLGLLERALTLLNMPILVRSGIITAGWVALTGGLHLDGAMDTADGLAVLDPQRRLEVMADSRSGAFGVMAAILILLLKSVALTSLHSHRWWALMVAAGWGRWGQLVAIARYPYLKQEGKGAFHKVAIRSTWEAVPSWCLLLGVSSVPWLAGWSSWPIALFTGVGSCLTALAIAAWFHHKIGGHTGDTYGAVVEWTEVFILCGLTLNQ